MNWIKAAWGTVTGLNPWLVGAAAGLALALGAYVWSLRSDNGTLSKSVGTLTTERDGAVKTANDNAETLRELQRQAKAMATSAAIYAAQAADLSAENATLLERLDHAEEKPTGCRPSLGDPAPDAMVDALRAAAGSGAAVGVR